MNNTNQVQYSNLGSSDLLKHKGLKIFYDSKEAVHAYTAIGGIGAKREISSKVIELLNNFLNYEYSQEEIDFINDLFYRNSTKINTEIETEKETDIDLFEFLKSLDPRGVHLLEIENDIDIKILKKLYRKVSLKNHPDVGGTNEIMKEINSAYSLFNEAISSFILTNNESQINYIATPPDSWVEWMYSVHLILSCIYSDLFATDKAFDHLIKSNHYSMKSNSHYVGQFIYHFNEHFLDRICHAFARFDMEYELKLASQIISNLYDRYIQDWHPKYKDDSKPIRSNYPNEIDLLATRRVNIVFHLVEQVKNAYRLGKIDEKRYITAMGKFDIKTNTQELELNKINEFIDTVGFIDKVSATDYSLKSINPKVVAVTYGQQDRFDLLEEDQKWEYLYVFSNKNTAHMYDKYYWIRAHEILVGLINNYDNIDLNKLNKEIMFFKNNFKEYDFYILLDKFYHYFINLDDTIRKEKLQILSNLDEPSKSKFERSSSRKSTPYGYTYSGIVNNKIKKRIQVTNDYIVFAKMSLDFLSNFKNNEE